MLNNIKIVDNSIIDEYDYIVFEGSQGLLLDRNNTEYFHNLTPSNTGLENVVEIISNIDNFDMEVCYVTRSYFTRHGAGRFNTECDSTEINRAGLMDKTNQTNEYQGAFRYGYFDCDEIEKSIKNDLKHLHGIDAKVGLAVTHLNETDGKIATQEEALTLQDLSDKIGIEVKYTSYTEKAEDVLWYDKDSEKSYHKGRIAFAELPNGEVVVLTNDTRSHIEWLSEDYNITKEEFNSLCRGYIDESNVIMYKGVEFSAIDDTDRVLNSKWVVWLIIRKEYIRWSYSRKSWWEVERKTTSKG